MQFSTTIERDKSFRGYKAYNIEVCAEIAEGVGYELFASVDPFVKVRKVTFADGSTIEPVDMVLELTPDEVIALEPEALRRL